MLNYIFLDQNGREDDEDLMEFVAFVHKSMLVFAV